jgi:hypothetical protein
MATMSHRDLKQLEGRLDKGLGKIRARKVQFTRSIFMVGMVENNYFVSLTTEIYITCRTNCYVLKLSTCRDG